MSATAHLSDTAYPDVLALGDSLTAGYGLAAHEAFPAQLESRLRDHYPHAVVRNAGVSGDTSSAALNRLAHVLSGCDRAPDLAIVELGANDLLRGVPPRTTRANLDAILTELSRCGIPVLLAAMTAPRFLGGLADVCDAIYDDLATRHGAAVRPFFPAGVLGHPALTLPDRLHPNARAVVMIADHMLPGVLDALATVGRRATLAA